AEETGIDRDPVHLSGCLSAKRSSLEQRLDDGYRRIDEAVVSGADVSEWEAFWFQLLGEYEEVCRELDVAA
ncbi:MAG: hypothetical protein M3Q50_14425, partial [Chloroflexota bacterium]|nr:hypothetical protein [Chloroflexota bacterium]